MTIYFDFLGLLGVVVNNSGQVLVDLGLGGKEKAVLVE